MKELVQTVKFVAILTMVVSCASQQNPTSQNNAPQRGNQGQRQQGGPGGARPQMGQNNRGGANPPTFAQLLSQMDTNEDGQLSKDEIKGPLANDFSKVDTDEDGFITAEEFKNAPRPGRN